METKLSILYAEDDPVCAIATRVILEQHGYLVRLASNGRKAWEAYQALRPDILLLDLDMPEMDGLQLTRLVREKDTHTHIIVYTAYAASEREIAIVKAGADEFYPKEKAAGVLALRLDRLRERMVCQQDDACIYKLSLITTYNRNSCVLTINGEATKLPTVEGRLLRHLCAKFEQVASRQYLLEGIWEKAIVNKANELKKYVSRLRDFLAPDPSLHIDFRDDGYILYSTE